MKTAEASVQPSPAAPSEPLLTKAEAAKRLNVAERFIERCVEQRRIRYVRVGRFVRIPESALADFVTAATVPTAQTRALPGAPRHRRTAR